MKLDLLSIRGHEGISRFVTVSGADLLNQHHGQFMVLLTMSLQVRLQPSGINKCMAKARAKKQDMQMQQQESLTLPQNSMAARICTPRAQIT